MTSTHPQINWQLIRQASVFAILLVSQIDAYSVNWIEIDDSTRFSNREVRHLDTDSVQNSSGDVLYRMRLDSYWSGKNHSIERNVVADCSGKRRFEVVTQNDISERPFKTVFPGTAIGKEFDAACNIAAGVQPKPNPPREVTPQPAPQRPNIPSNTNRISTGSGFIVAERYLVTNYHVVKGCRDITIRQSGREITGFTYATNPANDLSLVALSSPIGRPAHIRSNAALGEDVMVAGYPLTGLLSSDIVVTGGHVNSLAGLRNDPTSLQISAPVQPGNSGGPLIDKSGNIVGVIVSKLNAGRLAESTGDIAQNVNFAIKPEILRLFLSANSIPISSGGLNKRLESAQLAELARTYTAQVICRE